MFPCQMNLDTDIHISCHDLWESKLVGWCGVLGGRGQNWSMLGWPGPGLPG
jgi:hypothetical protein